MIGTEDRILNPWAHFAKKYSFLPLMGDGSTKCVLNLLLKLCSFILPLSRIKSPNLGSEIF